jgi:YD repeat-containing protein
VYATTDYGYGVRDELLQVTDAADNVTSMTYDLLGRKTAMHDPDMGAWSYVYDPLGNLITQTDAKGQVNAFQYDLLNRLTLKDLPSGTDVHYYYDEGGYGASVGRRTRRTDASGWTKWYYLDSRGRLTHQTSYVAGT